MTTTPDVCPRFQKLRAMDGTALILCPQFSSSYFTEVIDVGTLAAKWSDGEFGESVYVAVNFREYGRLVFPQELVPLPGEDSPVFGTLLPSPFEGDGESVYVNVQLRHAPEEVS